ncbi:hypothetical protein DFH28DRAFT_929276 [Melampsora americana]|nr:hypothetical protein DFH28DRAFT_929276 [Melampsora americana]
MIKNIKVMLLIHWAIIIVTLDQHRCGSVHLSKPELGSPSEPFISDTSPESILTDEAVSPSIHSAQIITPVDSSPHPCAEEKETITHTTSSAPVEAGETRSYSQNVNQDIHKQPTMPGHTAGRQMDNRGHNMRSAANPKSTLRGEEHLNGIQDFRPNFSLGGAPRELPAIPIYSTPSIHSQLSSFAGLYGTRQQYLEPYSHSAYPIQQHPYYSMPHGFHEPPLWVDSLSGTTYVPYYGAVSTSTPFYTQFLPYFHPPMIYPAIPAYLAPEPLYSWHQNNFPYGFENPPTNRQVQHGNPRPEDMMENPLQSDGRYTAFKPRKANESSGSHKTSDYSRSPESFRKNNSQTTKSNKKAKETDVESKTKFLSSKRKSFDDQPPVKKVQLKQKVVMNKSYAPSGTEKLRSDRTEQSHMCSSQLKEKMFRSPRPQYSSNVKSNQHVNNLIASSMQFGVTPNHLDDHQLMSKTTGVEKVLIGENWVSLLPHRDITPASALQSHEQKATPSTRKILKPWSAEQGHTSRSTMPKPSDKITNPVGQHVSHLSDRNLDMDLWIRNLKNAERFPTFDTGNDLFNHETHRMDFALESVNPIQSEKISAKVSKVSPTRPSPILNLDASQEVKIETEENKSNSIRENLQKDQSLNKGILRHSKKVLLKHRPAMFTLEETKPSFENDPEDKKTDFVVDKRLANIMTTQNQVSPHINIPPGIIAQKDQLFGGPKLKQVSREGSTSRNMAKYNHLKKIEKNKTKLVNQTLKEDTQQGKKKVDLDTGGQGIQNDDDQKDLPSDKLVIIDSDDLKEKFIVPSSIKSAKTKKDNLGGFKRNARKAVASSSKHPSKNAFSEDKETESPENDSKSNYKQFEWPTPQFPNFIKGAAYIGAIPTIQETVPVLWNWMKNTPETILKRVNVNWIPKWVHQDELSSKSTSISSLGETTMSRTASVDAESKRGLLEKVTTKISYLKPSTNLGEISLIPKQVPSLWSWMKDAPEHIWRRADEFWNQKKVQEDELNREPPKDSPKNFENNDQDRSVKVEDHISSLKTGEEGEISNSAQKFPVQTKASLTSQGLSSEKGKNKLFMQETEPIQMICNMLKLKNKKKFLPLEITQEEYLWFKDHKVKVDKDLYQLASKTSRLSTTEFTRRTLVMQRQLKQHELTAFCSQWDNALSQHTKDHLIGVFKGDTPWPTFTNINKAELKLMTNGIECINQDPRFVDGYNTFLGAEFKVRQDIISYMLNRKSSHKWWDEEKLQEGRKQALNIVRLLTIGDVLEFGELNISANLLTNRNIVEKKIETLYDAFMPQEENVFPWHESPERAWLESQPELWKLYQERFRIIIMAFETLTGHNYTVVSDNGTTNENVWWQFGDYLMWIDEGINKYPIPAIGDSLKLGKDRAKNAKILESVNWKAKLKSYDPDTRRKIQTYFEKRKILNSSELKIEKPISITEKLKRVLQYSVP